MNEVVWLLVGLACATLLLHAAARLLYLPVSTRLLGQAPWIPEGRWEPIPEGLSWQTTTADGVLIRGTFLPRMSPERHGTVVFCHGLNGDRWNALPYAALLRPSGFDVYTFDFRNHGQSGRAAGYEPMPWVSNLDLADLRAVIQYVLARLGEHDRGIALMGISKGASVAVCAAAEEPRVRALILDSLCPLERLQAWCTRMLVAQWFGPAPWVGTVAEWLLWPAGAWAKCLWGWRRGCRLLSMVRALRRVGAPVLLIHGQCDVHVPLEAIVSLRRAIRAPHDLWVVPRAKHTAAITVAPEEYARRANGFLLEHLAGWPARPQAEPKREREPALHVRKPVSATP